MTGTNGVIQLPLANIAGWLRAQPGSRAFLVLATLLLALLRTETLQAQDPVKDRPASYVGEIIIVGNWVTQNSVILKALDLYPGEELRYPNLRIAERNLARLNIFEVNPELGIRPTVTVLENAGPFKDILVKVQETRTGSFTIKGSLTQNAGLVIRVVLEERNFDPWRWPTRCADFFEGRAFRGGGQKIRLELLRIPLLPGRGKS